MADITSLHGSAESRGTTAPGKLHIHHFALFLWLSLLCLSRASLEAQTTESNLAVIVQHAPRLNGGGVIRGSLQQLDGENVTLNDGFQITGDLLVPGIPRVIVQGHPAYAGTIPGNGSSAPSGYTVTLDRYCSFNYLRTRTTPVTLPIVLSPPRPAGTRSVTITHPGQSYGSPNTLRDLTLAGNAGSISVPPGTYGNFVVNGCTGLIIGVAGADQPATYNLQHLTLNGNSTLKVVGPVILTVANGFTVNGRVGNPENPTWLQLNIASGNLVLNCGSVVHGVVTIPSGWLTIGANSRLVGASASADFDLNCYGIVRWAGKQQTILPPVATNQTIVLVENGSTNVTMTASDPQDLPLTYSVLTEPAHGTLSGTPPNVTYHPAANFFGDDSFTFDVNNGVTDSSPATISLVVTQNYFPPTAYSQTLTNLENTALPVTLTGSDPQNNPLTYSILTQPSHGTLSGTPPNLVYQPAANYFGNDAFTFQASDGVSNSAPATISITVKAVDEPPVVSAGPNQLIILPTNSVTINGAVSYSEFPNTVDTVIWSQLSGLGTVTFSDASSLTTTATFSTNGVYVLQFYASDSYLSASNTLKVTVDAPPVINAGPETTNTFPGSITLQGTASDDGLPYGVLNLNWSEVSGPGTVSFSNPSATNSVAAFSTNGIYDLRLTADDGIATNYSDVTVIENMPPAVNAGANFLVNGLNAVLSGSISDDGLPSGYLAVQWVQSGGPGTATFGNPTSANTAVSVNQSGPYAFTLIATDGAATNSSLVDVTFNLPPVVNAGVAQTNLFPAGAQLSGTVTDDGLPVGGQLTWSWSVVSGPGTVTFNNAALTNATATFSQSGLYVLQLTASDSAAVSSNQVVIIEDSAPTVQIATNQLLAVTNQALLTGTITDDGLPPGAELTAAWGEVSGPAAVVFNPAVPIVQSSPLSGVPVTNVVQATVTFSVAGTYVISLTADDSFASASATVSLSVSSTIPVVSAGPDLFLSGIPAMATLNGQVSDAILPPGATLTQQWSVVGGPGTVTFGSPTSPVTTVTFSTNGIYVLQLTANNGQSQASSMVEVRVETLCTVQDPEGLAAWWPANGNAMDVVGGQRAVLNGVGYANGEVALAFSFNGKSYVRAPAASNYNVGSSPAGFSLEFWTKGTPGFTCGVLDWSNGVALVEGGGNNGLYVNIVDTAGNGHPLTSPAVNVFDGQWHHVALTYDPVAGVADIYKDGVMQVSQNIGSFQPQTSHDLYFGQAPGYSDFEGELDEISLYQRPLGPEEVYNIYASGSVGKCPDTNTIAVYAGANFAVPSPTNTLLNGSVTENGQPAGTNVQVQWTQYYGPEAVNFADPTSATTPVTFSANGIYILQLIANNNDEESSSLVEVRVGVPCDDENLSNLSAWWPADGTAEDIVSGNKAILGGGINYANGEVALAFNLDGAGEYVLAPAATNYNVGASSAGMTIEFWTRGTPGDTCGVLGWNAGVSMVEGGGNNALYVNIVDTNGISHALTSPAVNVFDGQWHHVAVTYDRMAGVADIYKDGVMVVSQAVGSFQPQTTTDFYMGQVSGYSDFKGQLDEISLYSQPLSSEAVAIIYAAGSAGKCPN